MVRSIPLWARPLWSLAAGMVQKRTAFMAPGDVMIDRFESSRARSNATTDYPAAKNVAKCSVMRESRVSVRRGERRSAIALRESG